MVLALAMAVTAVVAEEKKAYGWAKIKNSCSRVATLHLISCISKAQEALAVENCVNIF